MCCTKNVFKVMAGWEKMNSTVGGEGMYVPESLAASRKTNCKEAINSAKYM